MLCFCEIFFGTKKIFPSKFAKLSTKRVPSISLILISFVTFLLTLTGRLEFISSMGAIAFLAVFLFVNFSALKLKHMGEIKINTFAPLTSIVLCILAIITLIWYYIFNLATQDLVLIFGVIIYYLLITIVNWVTLRNVRD